MRKPAISTLLGLLLWTSPALASGTSVEEERFFGGMIMSVGVAVLLLAGGLISRVGSKIGVALSIVATVLTIALFNWVADGFHIMVPILGIGASLVSLTLSILLFQKKERLHPVLAILIFVVCAATLPSSILGRAAYAVWKAFSNI